MANQINIVSIVSYKLFQIKVKEDFYLDAYKKRAKIDKVSDKKDNIKRVIAI